MLLVLTDAYGIASIGRLARSLIFYKIMKNGIIYTQMDGCKEDLDGLARRCVLQKNVYILIKKVFTVILYLL